MLSVVEVATSGSAEYADYLAARQVTLATVIVHLDVETSLTKTSQFNTSDITK